MELPEILCNIYPLPPAAIAKIAELAETVTAEKGATIISSDRIDGYVYFVAKGIVRAFCNADGRDITFWIGAEGSVALSMQGYINGRKGYESIITIEHCSLYRVPVKALHNLYLTDIDIANWGRVFAEKEILRAEKSLIPQLFTTGRERYEALQREQPQLLNRIPLEVLATYLGLTPVSLSRIRAQICSGEKRR